MQHRDLGQPIVAVQRARRFEMLVDDGFESELLPNIYV